ncbi:copine I-like protein [Strigomonas culicis]|uniref:Copine I-like protein n=1 Tax=Strigomonas culicis TaxID=28005 RepID=S9V7Y7_9TRYP|nr:copine I-like protein [Strigomonas culicis]|eukprot:EPY36958.1 copine I-like protein [Strigomonas culicis]
MDLVSKSDPYFILRYRLPNGQLRQVYRSEAIQDTLDPQWRSTPDINLRDLCGGDTQSPCIEFACFDEDLVNDDPMGTFLVSAEQLMAGTGEFQLTTVKKDKTKSYGTICLAESQFVKTTTFLEHMKRGLQINIAFSIDFTGSNGNWTHPSSLHYFSPQMPNQYIRAMLAVSDVVQEYDTDRQFPVYGFGAQTPFPVESIHFFPLTGNYQNAYVNGMQAVVDTYAGLLPQLRFSGPTNFAPTIRAITTGARQARGVYTILLIMTDGAITDMRDTIDAIVDADDAPLSIIIIGIGNSDFSSMVRLDGDDERLCNSVGKLCRRDLVQFVVFNQFLSAPPERLAAAVLEEVPRQVEIWGRLNGIQ